jgi:ABC-type sugar transport system ATPase subunit
MRELASQGAAILWVASDAGEIVRVCDHALAISEGAITGALSPTDDENDSEEVLLSCATSLRQGAMHAPAW